MTTVIDERAGDSPRNPDVASFVPLKHVWMIMRFLPLKAKGDSSLFRSFRHALDTKHERTVGAHMPLDQPVIVVRQH